MFGFAQAIAFYQVNVDIGEQYLFTYTLQCGYYRTYVL